MLAGNTHTIRNHDFLLLIATPFILFVIFYLFYTNLTFCRTTFTTLSFVCKGRFLRRYQYSN